ncbi:MAG: recombinase family protein [Oscillospiraceae bacterium]|nr:recombinase family protein [Oscillospiraceae bacterium]
MKWGKRKTFVDGKVSMPYKHFLGYKKDEETGLPVIVENEANIIKLIYKCFLEDKSPSAIAKILTNLKIPSPSGKEKWYQSTIKSILTNEKYRGDAILQKTFCTDFLTKKKKINEGEIPQYYVKNSHEAIIEPEIFEAVQNEIKARDNLGRSTIHIFFEQISVRRLRELFRLKAVALHG